MEPAFYTRTQFAQIMGESERTVDRKIRDGIYPRIKSGNKVRIPKSFVDELQATRTSVRLKPQEAA